MRYTVMRYTVMRYTVMRYTVKNILVLSIFFCVIALTAMGQLTDTDIDKIQLIVNDA